MNHFINLLKEAGITVNGSQPWDIQIHNNKLYNRLLRQGSLGLGEAYMDGWWEVDRLDAFFARALRSKMDDKYKLTVQNAIQYLRAWSQNLQTKEKASSNIIHHYDIGYDLYKSMLDKRMVYTCAYWNGVSTLDEAQEAKLDLVCKKLDVKENDHILDIGCGWGSFAKFAAKEYGAKVTGVTISPDQVKYARKMCMGLPVEIRLQDYRDVSEKFDKIVSLGMLEHVGFKNYKTYMNIAAKALKKDGLFLIQAIGRNTSAYKADAWISKYIFPNGMLPSVKQIGKALENNFVMEDWHNFGPDYDHTLMAWFDNFESHWDDLKSNYTDRFYRMWKYYLLSCAGAFRSRSMQLWQIVLSKNGLEGGYRPLRYRKMVSEKHGMEK